MRIRTLLGAALSSLAAAALIAPVAASAAAPSPDQPAGHIGGVIPSKGAGHVRTTASNNLTYHGGPVMAAGNNVYVIYWVPSGYTVDAGYEGLVSQFFGNVAAASGAKSNVYAVDTQYSSIQYNSVVAGTAVDSDPLPTNGCRDSYTKVCLSDNQIQNEINRVRNANNWPTGPDNLFFMLTANGIGSCSGRSSCAFSQYCAYHGYNSSTGLFYANMPYAYTVPSACYANESPNNDPAADAEINLISHEHNEAITDEALNAWYDSQGYEIGDKCAWNFGAATGPAGAEYNQTINGNTYYLQQEWSNASKACALNM